MGRFRTPSWISKARQSVWPVCAIYSRIVLGFLDGARSMNGWKAKESCQAAPIRLQYDERCCNSFGMNRLFMDEGRKVCTAILVLCCWDSLLNRPAVHPWTSFSVRWWQSRCWHNRCSLHQLQRLHLRPSCRMLIVRLLRRQNGTTAEGDCCMGKSMTKMRRRWAAWQATPDCSARRKRCSPYQEPGSMHIVEDRRFLMVNLFANLPEGSPRCRSRAGPWVGIRRLRLRRRAGIFLQSHLDT